MTEVKKVVGTYSGEFVDESTGELIKWFHLYVNYPKDNVNGLAVMICKCLNETVLNGVLIGDYVELYYNEKKKVVLINPVVPDNEVLELFGAETEPTETENIVED